MHRTSGKTSLFNRFLIRHPRILTLYLHHNFFQVITRTGIYNMFCCFHNFRLNIYFPKHLPIISGFYIKCYDYHIKSVHDAFDFESTYTMFYSFLSFTMYRATLEHNTLDLS